MDFNSAFEIVIGHEGGYVNDPLDPGGETKFGISKRAYPHEDIRNMTLDRAKQIYLTDYWNRCQCEQLPDAVRLHMFDAAVNSGTVQATRWLQRAVMVPVDCVIGAKTVAACRALDPFETASKINAQRLLALTELKTWSRFGRGWVARIARNMM